jgi:hypothetical protein
MVKAKKWNSYVSDEQRAALMNAYDETNGNLDSVATMNELATILILDENRFFN